MRSTSFPARGKSGRGWLSVASCSYLAVGCVLVFIIGNVVIFFQRRCETALNLARESERKAVEHLESAEKQLSRFKKERSSLQKEVEALSLALEAAEGGTGSAEHPKSKFTGHEAVPGAGGGGGGEGGRTGRGDSKRPPSEMIEQRYGKDPADTAHERQRKGGDRDGDSGGAAGVVRRRPLTPFPLSPKQQEVYREATGGRGEGKAAGSEIEPAPRDTRSARALLIICYNRPDYLRRTLQAVLERLPSYNRPHVYVSQDGGVEAVSALIQEYAGKFREDAPDVPFVHLRHPGSPEDTLTKRGEPAAGWALGYYKLSAHFKWALTQLFEGKRRHPRVIILEDDLEIAVDFFDYFSAVEPLLEADHTLLAASAWSDLGQPSFVADPRQVHRSDFFPGLGWMLTSHVWEALGPKWPEAFWDDWLREPPQRQGRHFLRPEVSRTYTFGESGVSQAQFFAQYLGNIHLNGVPVDWASEDLSYLGRQAWDAELAQAVAGAKRVGSLPEAVSASCQAGAGSVTTGLSLDGRLVESDWTPSSSSSSAAAPTDILFPYAGEDGYRAVAAAFSFIDDIKAHVPRTAYKLVTVIKHGGCRKLLVAQEALAALAKQA